MKKRVILLIGVALSAGALVLWEPMMATENASLPKRSYDVQIVRDAFGVPHINGKTDADASYGLAYAHAEDDFDTIQEVIAMTRGRSGACSAVKGPRPITRCYCSEHGRRQSVTMPQFPPTCARRRRLMPLALIPTRKSIPTK